VGESSAKGCRAPAHHGDSEDAVGTKPLDRNNPEDIADDVGNLAMSQIRQALDDLVRPKNPSYVEKRD
jgi:hypothetical protein